MEGKLIKTGEQFLLRNKEDEVIAITSGTMEGRMLSLKNCQAIVNGYDLDELAVYHFGIVGSEGISSTHSFKVGFQKALEILGDKKFSEEDILDAWEDGTTNEHPLTKSKKENLLQSLQQTEWDVEICCYIGNGDKESDSFKDPLVTNTGIPKLDANGCLILRRI
jgi:hypothetical protein